MTTTALSSAHIIVPNTAEYLSSVMAFTLFPQLPPEIRCSIFLLASDSEPRIVPIHYDEETISYRPRIKPPAILHVNRECRHEALKVYHELRLGQKVNTGCYINPSKDSVYLKSNLRRTRARNTPGASIDAWLVGRLTRAAPTEETLTQIAQSQQHPAIVFNDLINSPDREIIFKSFHTNSETWTAIWRYYVHLRHKLPVRLQELCLVYEIGSGPLKEDFEIKDVPRSLALVAEVGFSPLCHRFSVAWRVAQSYKASAGWVNREDRKLGQPASLQYQVLAKYIGMEV